MREVDLTWIQGICNLISIITIIYFTKKIFLRTEEELKKKWMVIGLIASDALMSTGYILIIGNADKYDTPGVMFTPCKFQAFLIHFGMLGSFMWINCIVLVIYNSLYSRYDISPRRISLVCTVFPLSYCLL